MIPEDKPTFVLDSVRVWFESPTLLCVSARAHEQVSAADAVKIMSWAVETTKGERYKVLYIPEKGSNVSPELRAMLADPERAKRIIADAMVVASFPHRLLADFYLRFNKPAVATKLFSNEEAARRWLETV